MTDYDTMHNTDPERWPLLNNADLEQIRRLEAQGFLSTPQANELRDRIRERERFAVVVAIALIVVALTWGMWGS